MLHVLHILTGVHRLNVNLLRGTPVGSDVIIFLPLLAVLLCRNGIDIYVFKILSHQIPNLALNSFSVSN